AGVPRRHLADGPAGLQRPRALGLLDDVERGAVLQRETGVEELALAEDERARLLAGTAQMDEGRPPDQIQNARLTVGRRRHGPRILLHRREELLEHRREQLDLDEERI